MGSGLLESEGVSWLGAGVKISCTTLAGGTKRYSLELAEPSAISSGEEACASI